MNLVFFFKFGYALPLHVVSRIQFFELRVVYLILFEQQLLSVLFSKQLVLEGANIADHFE